MPPPGVRSCIVRFCGKYGLLSSQALRRARHCRSRFTAAHRAYGHTVSLTFFRLSHFRHISTVIAISLFQLHFVLIRFDPHEGQAPLQYAECFFWFHVVV